MSKNRARELLKLLQKKYRNQRREFLVEGVRCCRELLNSPLCVNSLIFTDRLLVQPSGKELLERAWEKNIPAFHTTVETLDHLCETRSPQPVAACAQMREHSLNAEFFEARRFLVLADIADPGNMGTLLRTAEAFGWQVICAGDTVDIYNGKVIRASMGAVFRLKIVHSRFASLLSSFEDMKVPYVVSIPGEGITPPLKPAPNRLALFLGNEAHGLPTGLAEKAHARVQIPMAAHVDSLNVAVAGAILLFLLQ